MAVNVTTNLFQRITLKKRNVVVISLMFWSFINLLASSHFPEGALMQSRWSDPGKKKMKTFILTPC